MPERLELYVTISAALGIVSNRLRARWTPVVCALLFCGFVLRQSWPYLIVQADLRGIWFTLLNGAFFNLAIGLVLVVAPFLSAHYLVRMVFSLSKGRLFRGIVRLPQAEPRSSSDDTLR